MVPHRTLRQLLEEPMEQPPFVVFPLLPYKGKLFIYGPKGHFKSMLLDNCIVELAEGWPLMGHWEVNGGPKTCMLFEQEVGPYMTRQRLRWITSAREAGTALDNIIIVSKERDIRLDTPDGYANLHEIISHYRPNIVALDPIRKFHRQDENDSTAITRVVDAMDRLIHELNVTLLIAHHQGHPSQFQNNSHMRGSTVWGDEADAILNLRRPTADPNKIRVTTEKVRHAADPPPFDLLFQPDSCTFRREVNDWQRQTA